MSQVADLDRIADEYHNSTDIPDKFIEDIQQDFSCEIMKKHLSFSGRRVLELGYGEGIISEVSGKTTLPTYHHRRLHKVGPRSASPGVQRREFFI